MQYSNYLAHYGVKGQKWGVRRYQNEDGSYTEAGRERYSVGEKNDKTSRNHTVKGKTDSGRTHINTAGKAVKAVKGKPARGVSRGIGDMAEQQAVRKRNARTLLKVAGAVALTAALAYGASTALRDSQAMKMKVRELDAWQEKNWSIEDKIDHRKVAQYELGARRKALTRRQAIRNLITGEDGNDPFTHEPKYQDNARSRRAAEQYNSFRRMGDAGGAMTVSARHKREVEGDMSTVKERIDRLEKMISGTTAPSEKKSLRTALKLEKERLSGYEEQQKEIEADIRDNKKRREAYRSASGLYKES